MARGAVTAITTGTGFLVIPLGRVGQGSDARSIRDAWFSATLRATRGEGMARFSVTAVTAVT